MSKSITTLVKTCPPTLSVLDMTSMVVEVRGDLASLELYDAQDRSSDIRHDEIHRKREVLVCMQLDTPDAVDLDVVPAGTLNPKTWIGWVHPKRLSP